MTAVEEPRPCRTCGTTKNADAFYRHQGGRRVHCKECMRAQWKERYVRTNGKDVVFDKSLRRRYGITLEQYEAMTQAQAGRCALCDEPPETKKRMHVDHDHVTGRVRALLCHHCNLLLGYAKDSTDRLRQAISYLEEHEPRPAGKLGTQT